MASCESTEFSSSDERENEDNESERERERPEQEKFDEVCWLPIYLIVRHFVRFLFFEINENESEICALQHHDMYFLCWRYIFWFSLSVHLIEISSIFLINRLDIYERRKSRKCHIPSRFEYSSAFSIDTFTIYVSIICKSGGISLYRR